MFNLPADPSFNKSEETKMVIFGIYAVSMYALLTVGSNLISIGFFSNFAKFCPIGFESTGYSIFASFLNFYNSMSKILAGYIIEKIGVKGPAYSGACVITMINMSMLVTFLIVRPFFKKLIEQDLQNRNIPSAVAEKENFERLSWEK